MARSPLNYREILYQVLNLAGIDNATLSTIEWRLFRDFISRRIKFAWQAAKWPEVCLTEERTVTQSGGDEGNYVALDQAGENVIGEVFQVYNKSPKSNQDVQELTWYLSENGIQIAESNATVFVQFRKTVPQLIGDLYTQALSYPIGGRVYDNTVGNFYDANTPIPSGSDNSPAASPESWDLLSIPYIFADYLIRGTYADYLRHNGELDRARVAESDARSALDHELFKLHQQQGQTTRMDVLTY